MARFVLVHGAWNGGWCWQRLAAELEARGHDVLAPDLRTDDRSLSGVDHAAALGSHPHAVVVGHSLGAQVAGLVDARLRVYLGGILPDGRAQSRAFAAGFGGFLRDDVGRSYWPDADTAARRLYPDCPRDVVDWAYPQLRVQAPIAPVAALGARDVVVATARDACVDPTWQVDTGRAAGARVVEIDTGHWPMLTHPEELAEVLTDLA